MTDRLQPMRDHLVRALSWQDAHVGFEKALDGIPAVRRGERPAGFEHAVWELLEHMRLAQKDLLDFCVNANYKHSLTWPDDYWPHDPRPSDAEWTASLADFAADRRRLVQLVEDPSVDLFANVPTGKGAQTYLRAVLLVIDHNAYHLGQVIAVRRALGMWPAA